MKNNTNKILDDSKFNNDQINIINKGIKEGLDVSSYAKPEFNILQMHEIYEGLKDGLDVSVYAKPEFDFEEMHYMRINALYEEKL